MLPKVHRLSRDKQIQQIFRTKIRSRTANFRILLDRIEEPRFKLLIVVPKKIFKKAHKRHRLRRKISAVFEMLLVAKRLPPFTACILQVTKPDALYKNLKDLHDELVPEVAGLYFRTLAQQIANPTIKPVGPVRAKKTNLPS